MFWPLTNVPHLLLGIFCIWLFGCLLLALLLLGGVLTKTSIGSLLCTGAVSYTHLTEGKHPGIVQYPLPILKANQETLASIYQKVQTMEDVYFVDFTNIAQSCLDYDDYIQKMKKATQETIEYYGCLLYTSHG